MNQTSYRLNPLLHKIVPPRYCLALPPTRIVGKITNATAFAQNKNALLGERGVGEIN